MINIEQYKPHSEVTKEVLIENNFRHMDGYYSYRFPVLKYKKDTTLWCNLYVDLEYKSCGLTVVDTDNNMYPSYFNRKYGGINKAVEKVERVIQSQLDIFIKNKILYTKNKKKKKEGVK